MDAAYHQKWFHVKGMLFPGIVFALIPAALVGWLGNPKLMIETFDHCMNGGRKYNG